ncbi:TolC family protein [Granulosicoccaceae sp. 1_MG-2023]|nr:TolC family protein [Granulosicoccaceae sp. 1_MG-2023]
MISKNQRRARRYRQCFVRRAVLATMALGVTALAPLQAQNLSVPEGAGSEQQSAAAALLGGHPVQELTPQAMRRLALTQAPTVLALASQRRVSEAALLQQQAAFDWVLGAAASYRKTAFFARSELITRERTILTTVDGTDLDGQISEAEPVSDVDEEGQAIAVEDSAGNLLCITVEGELVNPEQCALQTVISTQREFASGDGDPTDQWTFTLSGDRQFAMGSVLQLALSLSQRNKSFYPLDSAGLISALSVDDPIGNGSNYPWTSTLSLSYSTPLPFGSGFGERGSASSLGLHLAAIAARQAGPLEDANVANALLAVEARYWLHVQNWLSLQTAASIRAALDERLASAQRRFNARELTNYELAQVRSARASAMAREETARAEFVASSGALGAALALQDGALLVPAGTSQLSLPELRGREDFVQQVLDNNPQLQVANLSVDAGQRLLDFAEETLKPDLNVVLSVGLSQSDAVLGYESAGDSLAHVFDPDNTRWFAGLSYRLPFGRQAEKARREQAALSLRRTQNSVHETRVALAAGATTHYARLSSSRRLLAEAQERVRLAQNAFERALSSRNRGAIAEFEFIAAASERNRAELDYAARLAEAGQLNTISQALLGELSLQPGEVQ